MEKKKLSFILCIVVVISIFAGCSNKSETVNDVENNDNGESVVMEEEATIYLFMNMPEYAEAMNILIDEYKKVKPNIKINYETTQNDYPTLLKAKINSGNVPDVFASTAGKEMNDYADYSLDLTNEPVGIALAKEVKGGMTANEEIQGFPLKGNMFGIVYDKEIFATAGIESFPLTYDELELACEKLEAIGVTPFTTGFAEWWVYKHIFQSFTYAAQPDNVSGLVLDFQKGNVKISDYPELYDDFFNFIDLAIKYGDNKPLETDLSGEQAALATGKAAMMLGQGPWVELDLLKINPDLKIGFGSHPINNNPDLTVLISGADQALHIYKESSVKQETVDFVNWWYTSDYGKSWFTDVAKVIAPITDGASPDAEIVKQGNEIIDSGRSGEINVIYSSDSFHQAFGEIMQSYIAGSIDKDEACKQIETKWVELENN